MSKHILEKHVNCTIVNCPICDGGLANCIVCNGAEAAMPTDCPERKLTMDEMDLIQRKELDFIKGQWVLSSLSALQEYIINTWRVNNRLTLKS